jgi:hypothetical protein
LFVPFFVNAFLLIGCSRECHVERFMSIEFNIFWISFPPSTWCIIHPNLFAHFFLCFLRFLTNFYGKKLKEKSRIVLFLFRKIESVFCFVGWNIFIIPGRSFYNFFYCCHGKTAQIYFYHLFFSHFWGFIHDKSENGAEIE